MRKLLPIILTMMLILTITISYIGVTPAAAYDTQTKGASATASPDPIIEPTQIPIDTEAPISPSPTIMPINPRPDYEFRGADEDGYWHSGYYDYEELSQQEIKDLLDSAPTDYQSANIFTEWPTFTDPWCVGQLQSDYINMAAARLNAIRRLIGMDPLTVSDEDNLNAQYAAWLSCYNNQLSHDPMCDVNIPPEFCELGHQGASSSDIYNGGASLAKSIDRYMNDLQPNNILQVGHRRTIMNTALASTGFGQAGTYKAMSVRNRTDLDRKSFDFLSWPISGNMPIGDTSSMFSKGPPWSITFQHEGIRVPLTSDGLTITITHNGETISTLIYGVTPDTPYDANSYVSYGEYIRAENGNYSRGTTLIFRPYFAPDEEIMGEYTIEITNLYTRFQNENFSIKYKVNFFDLNNIETIPTDPIQPPGLTEPIIWGDTNCDGECTISDALIIMRYSMGIVNISNQGLINSDVDQDGQVTMADAILIMRATMNV